METILRNSRGVTRTSKSSSGQSQGGISGSKDLRIEITSILLFSASIFALVAFCTYNPSDPSAFSNAAGPASNACGKVGAYLAAAFLQWFGLGAFIVPAALFFMATTVFKREGSVRLWGTVGGMTVAVIALAVFLSLQWKFWPYSGSLILTGGAFGAWVADLLVKQFNSFGSSMVSLLVFFLAIALSTPVSIARMGAFVLSVLGSWGWRFGKLAGTYLLFLGGLIAMRVAHAAGDLLQKLLEAAIRRARERATVARQAVSERASEIEILPEPTQQIGNSKKADKKAKPVKAAQNEIEIGVEGESDSEDEEEREEESDSSEEPEMLVAETSGKSKKKGKSALEPTFEVPNALPELETPVQLQIKGVLSQEPKILPPESPAAALESASALAPATGATAAGPATSAKPEGVLNKVNERLARAASRVKKGNWKLPTIEFLRKPPKIEANVDRERLLQNSQILKQKFLDFGIEGEVTAVRPGPVITLYEFKPGPGVKVSRIAALADDLSMALSAQSVRILAPLPGKSVVGIEIPSDHRETVYMREFFQHPDFYGSKHSIPVVMGKDIGGQTYLSDLARMPHLLCAGQTGAGKSVFMNGLICSLLFRFTPDELRMILVDPKFIEFRAYQDIPHLLLPVVDDPHQAAIALKWAVREMERRYRILAKIGARNLASFNQKVDEMGADVIRDLLLSEENQEGEESSSATQNKTGSDWIEAFEPDDTGAPRVGKLPYIVVIIDELADLMMIAKKEVEVSIARIAQKARAAGIHLVIATQRPSTDVITGLIKANLPSRVSFQLASYVDSKTILDRAGAERLLGQGDMLFIPPGVSQSLRLHGAFVDDEEINKVTSFLKSQGKPAYRDEILLAADDEDGESEERDEDEDEMFQEAVELIKRSGHASASFLQRHLKVGYNRAARMIETMESRGIVGPADGARPREVLIR
jgi:S-DNA-T family DNA segregation ATPase FtsK/SpoIIIE